VLCFGASKGRYATYTDPHRLAPGFSPTAGPQALRELVRRYLHGYGPASPKHFASWLNIPPRRATEVFASLGDELEAVDLEGDLAWVVAGDTAFPSEPAVGIRLLPYFDAYVVGSQPRDWLFPRAAATRALSPTGQAGNYPVLLVDGVVGGVWHLRRTGTRLAITVEPLRELTKPQRRELDAEVALVGGVLEGEPSLTMGPVRVGPHA
jgi:hypothetical protein